ncbi:hypothetical protein BYT27DRAFT_7199003 [Phlegmacium glaucopus]|nr:hypothetical protein BYT27DRAFT_7199003 [Phlegmacium glaucopus]
MHINTGDIGDLLNTGAPIHTIQEHLAGKHHILTYKALACKYQRDSSQAGSSRSICAVTALNCVRLAFQLETDVEGDEESILQSFLSEEMITQVMSVVNDLPLDAHLDIDDLLEVPIFKETVVSEVKEQGHHSLETFKDLFMRLFPPESLKPIIAVIFKETPENIVCFRFQSSDACVFVIFDAHSRSEHPFGPAFILASDVDTIATYFNQLSTQQSIPQPAYKQDVTVDPCSFTALVIESRTNSSTINVTDLLTRSVAYLSEKLNPVDHTPPTRDLVPDHLERLRARAESLRTQNLADAVHKQDNNRQSSHTKLSTLAGTKDTVSSTKLPRRSEFGWQLNLQVSGTPSVVDAKNNRDPNLAASPSPLEIKKTPLTTDSRKEGFDWVAPLIPGPGTDGEDVNISLSSASKADKENTAQTLSHIRSRTEFGWQMALQQSLKTDKRKIEGGEDMTVVPQTIVQTRGVLLGKGREEVSGELSATQTLPKGSESSWQDVLVKRLPEEEEPVTASSSRYPYRDGALVLALQKRHRAEEDKVDNAVASSSSSHAKLGQKGVISPYHHELDLKPLPSTDGESSTIPRNPHYSSIFTDYFDVQRSNRELATLELPTRNPAEFQECGVCNELYGTLHIIELPTCTHTFCRECLRTFTKTKINEGRYPIFCPVCSIERTRVNQSHITQAVVDKLELSKQDLEKLNALQLVAHSVILHCPKCKQTMNVDRGEYATQRTIICPLPACRHKWCKECLKPLASSQTEHNCKQHGFDRLMRRKGWKYCPGCNTPVQKETGCNHMTCGSPGCNVHFCYKCGILIIDTSNGGDVGTAVTEHYINCVMFEKRRRCIIQ